MGSVHDLLRTQKCLTTESESCEPSMYAVSTTEPRKWQERSYNGGAPTWSICSQKWLM